MTESDIRSNLGSVNYFNVACEETFMNSRLMMILSMTIFGTLGIFVRNIPVSSGELALYRAVLAALLITVFLIVTGQKIEFANMKKEVPLLLTSGVAMGINWILLFEAYKYTTVSVATLSYYFAPVILLNKFIKNVEGIHRTFFQFLSAIIVLVPYVIITSGVTLGSLNGSGWVNLLIVGLIHTGVTYCMYFSSLKELPGQKAAILSYIDPLVAVFVSVTV